MANPRPGAPSVRSAQLLPSSIDETVAAALALVSPSRGYLPHARGVCSRATMAYESAPLVGNRANQPLHAQPLHAQPLHGQNAKEPPPPSTILGNGSGAEGLARYGAGGSDVAGGTAEDATGARDDAHGHVRGRSTQRAPGRSPRFACGPACSTQRALAASIASPSTAQHGAHGPLDAGHGDDGGGGGGQGKPLDTALFALERTYAERLTDPPVRTADDL